jgi:hypothetical protein
MVRIVHNLTLRPLKIARHLIPDILWRLINFPLVISATLNVENVSERTSCSHCWLGSATKAALHPSCGRAFYVAAGSQRATHTLLLAVRGRLAYQAGSGLTGHQSINVTSVAMKFIEIS